MDDKRRYHKIVGKILKLINSGSFPPGTRLPSERDLAKTFGVCRTSIREAEIVLQAQGHLEVREGSGAYVLSRSKFILNDIPAVGAFELLQARALFEAGSVALAAPIIKNETLQELETYIPIISGKIKSNMTPVEAAKAFYNAIAHSTNNRTIISIIDNMWKMWIEMSYSKTVHQRIYGKDSFHLENEHIAILRALRNKDSVAARKAVWENFERIFEALLTETEEKAYQEVKREAFEIRSRFLLSAQAQ